MKALSLFAVLISGSVFAQTNVIAAKSHASTPETNQYSSDNFGEFIPPRTIESVHYLNGDCIVEIYAYEWAEQGKQYDTICNHPFLQPEQTDVNRLKEMYPEHTEFSGFEAIEKKMKSSVKEKNKQESIKTGGKRKKSKKSNIVLLFLAVSGLFLAFLFIPTLRLKTT